MTLVDDFVSNCDQVIEWLDGYEWSASTLRAEHELDSMRTSQTLFFDMLGWKNPDFIHSMNKNVWTAINDYAVEWNFNFYRVEPVSAQRYSDGAQYKTHVDHGNGDPRICSALLYLNDDFSDGRTYFPTFDYAIEPKPGRLAIFPSNYIYSHSALPVTVGTKYALAYWANG